MKRNILLLLFCFYHIALQAQVTIVPIKERWEFRQEGNDQLFPAIIPGSLNGNLVSNKIIGRPGTQQESTGYIAGQKKGLEYMTAFSVGTELLASDKISLIFDGLIGQADVFVNDSLIFKNENANNSKQADISEIIRQGTNKLVIYFHPLPEQSQVLYPANSVDCTDQADMRGLWEPVVIKAWKTAVIKNFHVEQQNITAESATLIAHLDYDCAKPFFGAAVVTVDGKRVKGKTVQLQIGENSDNIVFEIDNPTLWQPRGAGDQKLYTFGISLSNDKTLIDSASVTFGLKTIDWVEQPDKHRGSASISVNGKPVRLQGAYYSPSQSYSAEARKNSMELTVRSAADAGMNVIAAESCSFPYKSFFENLCEKHGLLIWQFSESGNQAKQPSNEPEGKSFTFSAGLQKIELPDRASGSLLIKNDFESLPDLKTLEIINKQNPVGNDSSLIQQYLMSSYKDKTKADIMLENFDIPSDPTQYILLSQLLQGEAIMADIARHRSKNPPPAGSILKNFNDCRPSVSASLINYSGDVKASYYFLKRALSKVITTFTVDKDLLKIYCTADTEEDEKAVLTVELCNLSGKVLISTEKKVKLKAGVSEELWKGSIKELVKKQQKDEIYLHIKLTAEEKVIHQNVYCFVPLKEMKKETPQIKYEFETKDDKLFVHLSSNKTIFYTFLHAGGLDLIFTDNFFTLEAKEKKTIEILGDYEDFDIRNKLTVNSLAELF